MLRTRQITPPPPLTDDDELTEEFLSTLLKVTATYTISYAKGHFVPDHSHHRGMLIRPLAGAMRVQAGSDVWLVTVGQALWLCPGTAHATTALSPTLVQFVYVDPSFGPPRIPSNSRIDILPLLGGILDELRAMPAIYEQVGPLDRLTSVMLDQVVHAYDERRLMECPNDHRLAIIYQMITRDPSDRQTLKQLASEAGISAKTLERTLRAQCGMSFREWRERIILDLALNRLKYAGRVTGIALDLGYTSASAFISAFRKVMNITPKQYAARFAGNASPHFHAMRTPPNHIEVLRGSTRRRLSRPEGDGAGG